MICFKLAYILCKTQNCDAIIACNKMEKEKEGDKFLMRPLVKSLLAF